LVTISEYILEKMTSAFENREKSNSKFLKSATGTNVTFSSERVSRRFSYEEE